MNYQSTTPLLNLHQYFWFMASAQSWDLMKISSNDKGEA
jgi:hypothetical protein